MSSKKEFTGFEFHALLENTYLPLISGALLQTQIPEMAASIVRDLYVRVIRAPYTEWDPSRLYVEMLHGTFNKLLERAHHSHTEPSGRLSPVPQANENYHIPVSATDKQSEDLLNTHTSHPEKNSIESWLLFPLMQEEPDRAKRGIKAALLCWLSDIKSDALTVAILASWLQYDPLAPDAHEVLRGISRVTNMCPERIHRTWRRQLDLWENYFTEGGPSLLDAMAVWLESINLTKEDFLRDYMFEAIIDMEFAASSWVV